jgi:hypothetical protein
MLLYDMALYPAWCKHYQHHSVINEGYYEIHCNSIICICIDVLKQWYYNATSNWKNHPKTHVFYTISLYTFRLFPLWSPITSLSQTLLHLVRVFMYREFIRKYYYFFLFYHTLKHESVMYRWLGGFC